MVSTLTQTQVYVTFSTLVWMVRLRSTPAHLDSGLMNTVESVTGQRPLTEASANLRLMVRIYISIKPLEDTTSFMHSYFVVYMFISVNYYRKAFRLQT